MPGSRGEQKPLRGKEMARKDKLAAWEENIFLGESQIHGMATL